LAAVARVFAALVLGVLATAASADADVLAIDLPANHVAAGQALAVVVTPDAALDAMTFHGARVYVMKPGAPCPTTSAGPDDDELVGTASTGPFSSADPPMTLMIDIDPRAPSGPTRVCTQWWEIALSLAGDATPGPSRDLQIDPRAVATPPAGSPGNRCTIDPGALPRGRAHLRLHCGAAVPPTVTLRMSCTTGPRHRDRAVRLRGGEAVIAVDGPRAGRCAVSVRAAGRVLARRTLPVRRSGGAGSAVLSDRHGTAPLSSRAASPSPGSSRRPARSRGS
jgi:hypothetical protein